MAYKNARNVLPCELVREIQKHVDGELIYIPSKSNKTGWGIRSGAKQKYTERNRVICEQYKSGTSIEELAGRYYLSEDSIKKIVYGSQKAKRIHKKKAHITAKRTKC